MPADASALSRVRNRFLAGEAGSGDPGRQLAELVGEELPLLDVAGVERAVGGLARELLGMGPLEELLDDPEVTDVLVNGPGEVWVERAGDLAASGVTVDRESIGLIIERLVLPLGLRADRAHPIVDARRPDGTRVSVVLDPVAPDGPVVAIRRHRPEVLGLDRFGGAEVGDLLLEAVARQDNIVVYGPTGAGKTTLLNALVASLEPAERVVLIEDTCELAPARPGLVRLEARTGTAGGLGRVSMGELVRAALRLRPDRIVVGEVRGSEAADMVWALSTGHRGSMSTIHANTATDALARLELMVSMGLGGAVPRTAAGDQVARAVDLVVGVARTDGASRAVVSVHRCSPDGAPESVYRC